jgi:hypothetical protein
MKNLPVPQVNTRIGFTYYPDQDHYRESELQRWLPQLKALQASWLVLDTPVDRAIPEYFLRGLLQAGIEPVLHIRVPVEPPPPVQDLRLLSQTYARWGVHYIAIFDRPNQRSSWPASGWTQNNIVERFLDIYLPLAEAAVQAGLIPVLPPLEPGGDYWDTAFLRAALQGIRRRGGAQLAEKLVIGAYAFTWGRPITWGSGGSEQWPAARPYITPPGSEDQIGFRIFDWYLTISKTVLQHSCRLIIMGGGALLGEAGKTDSLPVDPESHAHLNLQIAHLLKNTTPQTGLNVSEVPDDVLACSFSLLAATGGSPQKVQAWFPEGEQPLPAVQSFIQAFSNPTSKKVYPDIPAASPSNQVTPHNNNKLMAHYLLLPVYEWGISDWHLEVIRPFVKKHRPSIGFSVQEAKLAARVTVVGGSQSFPELVIEELVQAGCSVRQIIGDGTNIASELASL